MNAPDPGQVDPAGAPAAPSRRRQVVTFLLLVLITATVTGALVALIVTMFHRKQEARNPFVRLVDVTEISTDPVPWGTNWPHEFNGYRMTVDTTRTRYGGSEGMPQQRIDRDPWLRRMYSGYAFSIDFRDRRGHAYMLYDQEQTERVAQRPQAGACLHCHASITPTWRRLGMKAMGQAVSDEALARDFNWPAVMKGFEIMSTMRYADAHRELLLTPDGTPGEDVPLTPGGSSVSRPTPANLPDARPAPTTAPSGAPTTRQALESHTGEAHPVSCMD
jgi:nitrite reductase (cytochrome c-552)